MPALKPRAMQRSYSEKILERVEWAGAERAFARHDGGSRTSVGP